MMPAWFVDCSDVKSMTNKNESEESDEQDVPIGH